MIVKRGYVALFCFYGGTTLNVEIGFCAENIIFSTRILHFSLPDTSGRGRLGQIHTPPLSAVLLFSVNDA